MGKERKKEAVVKIDAELGEKVDDFISRRENKIRYSSKKQFVDIAILEKLEKEGRIKNK